MNKFFREFRRKQFYKIDSWSRGMKMPEVGSLASTSGGHDRLLREAVSSILESML
jgi:hypothetical protein